MEVKGFFKFIVYCENCRTETEKLTPLTFSQIINHFGSFHNFFKCGNCNKVPDNMVLNGNKVILKFSHSAQYEIIKKEVEENKVEKENWKEVEEKIKKVKNLIDKQLKNKKYEKSNKEIEDYLKECAFNEFALEFVIRELILRGFKIDEIASSITKLTLENTISIENGFLKLVQEEEKVKKKIKPTNVKYSDYLIEKQNIWNKCREPIDKIMFKKVVPIWIEKRKDDFKEWDSFCINFPSLKYIPMEYHELIEEIFVNERGLNYYYLMKILGFINE